ncbi:hypothetical protein QTP88_001337 [Uroleucon formosanum]
MTALNDKVLQQGKNISALSHSVNTLGKQLNTVTNDVKSHGLLIDGLETRMVATGKTLSNIAASPPTTESTPSLNEIAREVQLRSLLAVNLIIWGVPKSLNISERISHDNKFVRIFLINLILRFRLNPYSAYRIGKTDYNKPRLLKIVLSSQVAVGSVVTTFPKLQVNPPDHLRSVSFTRDRTQSERQSIREIYQKLSARREKGESNI